MAVPDNLLSREDWNRRVEREIVLAAFGRWRFPWLEMAALIARTPEIYEFPLVDRDPVEGWSVSRVTLFGDAAHPCSQSARRLHPSPSSTPARSRLL